MKKQNKKKINTDAFDALFDSGDVTSYLDLDHVKVNRKSHRINLDIPTLLLQQIDQEANKIGIARTALIKVWLYERAGISHPKVE